MTRRDFMKALAATFVASGVPVLAGCNRNTGTIKIILFDFSGSVRECESTWKANKAKAQSIAAGSSSGDLIVIIPFRSKGTPRDKSMKFRTTKGPRNSHLKEDQERAHMMTGKILEQELASGFVDKATDVIGGLAYACRKAEELGRKYPGFSKELYVFSDHIHTRGPRLSGRFTPKNYNLYIELVREVVGQASLPEGIVFDRVECFAAHTCGLNELDHQAITFLHSAVEELWAGFLKNNVTPGNFYFHRSY